MNVLQGGQFQPDPERDTFTPFNRQEAEEFRRMNFGPQIERGMELTVHHPILHGGAERKPGGFNEGPAVFEKQEKRMGMWKPTGEQVPITHVYRGMSGEEWRQAQERGYIHSDQRGTLMPGWEGTNAAAHADTAMNYLPHTPTNDSVVAKIEVHPDDKWFSSDADSYLRTREKIPLSRVVSSAQVGTNRHMQGIWVRGRS